MRRSEKEMGDEAEIREVIRRSLVCRLGMVDDGTPYVVPLSFGYEDGNLFVHSAPEGRKIETLRKNPRVCFEFDVDCQVVRAEKPCNWSMRYRSVVGFGRAEFVDDPAEKRRALAAIMRQYADAGERFTFPDQGLERTTVIRVAVESMTGKQSGY
jgi:nitroimidazol reductase NimA-like FMN-containing flavoprotein (pyridoxamine 5'-phosphate oxidase superfamily)